MSLLLAATLAAETLYRQAIDAMQGLPQPSYVTYKLDSVDDGLKLDLVDSKTGVWLNIHGGSGEQHWGFKHRTYDYESELTDDSGSRHVSVRSFFDPTWYGAYRALHEGMLNTQDPAPPRSTEATPTPPPVLKTIAVESVMGTSTYAVEDRGETKCANGDPGHALHVWSIKYNPQHQLSDVVIDTNNMRFCMLRFSVNSALGFHGLIEQNFAGVGGYWMQTGGLMDGTLRAFGISMHHGVWRYAISDMQFPTSLPDDTWRLYR